jgi:hypothetical protein
MLERGEVSPARRSGANVSGHDQRGCEPNLRNMPRGCDGSMTAARQPNRYTIELLAGAVARARLSSDLRRDRWDGGRAAQREDCSLGA